MARDQERTLLAAVQAVPDPRTARGKRYSWQLLLTIIVAGLANNDQTARALAQWAHLHAEVVRAAVPDLTCIPSESTVLRVVRHIDAGVLEQKRAQCVASMPTGHGRLETHSGMRERER